MDVMAEKVTNMQGYKLHVVKTEKYKTNTLVWKMKAPLNKEDVTQRALLPHVLQSSSEKYPTTAALRSYLDDLYGASLFVDLAKKGEYHVMSFSLEIANEKFLSDPSPLLKKGFEFFSEILTKPHVKETAFHTDSFDREKRTLKQRIQSVYDDKMRYSNFRLVQEMCKGEPYALHVNGEMDDVEAITAESLYTYYQKAFAEDEMDFYVIGDVDSKEVESLAAEMLKFEPRAAKRVEKTNSNKRTDVNEVIEEQDIKQGKLNMGFRTDIVYGDPDYYALQVFNGIYGGFSHSKLFINVREKASLAYYAASRLESHKGLMMVMSGIDMKNYEQAVTIIKEQLEAMKNGEITDQELEQTKAVIQNQMLETIDTSRGLVEVLYHNVVSGYDITLEKWLEEMQNAKKEDVIAVAKKVELDTIYFLTGKEVQA
ncbi:MULTISPECIES: pitrilysin family protein [unclassified Bacillus (in: firmicutes)]|uniref:EF-P 5-aminopentanol modification-associated protein YfmF n=1 Tax=unclassified Bacillus (in: firmicutes) TaxID=185979 RepID=UPI0008E54E56|nr:MULTISPECIES: pitrilysin family protein [unclassified Bacillus (in: firmicutes)]SFA73150.1 Predicted Zn-dependent peptidase [Bacillus sp. UNCCL13]SFQ63268.1 Predicted Zn-dependent peptidase [Bacillus sp. cl95]